MVIARRHPETNDVRAYTVSDGGRGYHLDANFVRIEEDEDTFGFTLTDALTWVTGNPYWVKVWLPLSIVRDPDLSVDEGL